MSQFQNLPSINIVQSVSQLQPIHHQPNIPLTILEQDVKRTLTSFRYPMFPMIIVVKNKIDNTLQLQC